MASSCSGDFLFASGWGWFDREVLDNTLSNVLKAWCGHYAAVAGPFHVRLIYYNGNSHLGRTGWEETREGSDMVCIGILAINYLLGCPCFPCRLVPRYSRAIGRPLWRHRLLKHLG